MALAESYMKKAGYSSGKCTGNCTVTMVSDNTPPGSNTAQVLKSQLTALGFNVQLHPVEHATMYTKFCSVVANEPNVCPNVGWVKDFNDGQAMIDVPFNGATIAASPTNNSNWAQLNDPSINAALELGEANHRPDRAGRGVRQDRRRDHRPRLPRSRGTGTTRRTSRRRTSTPVINAFNGPTVDLAFTSIK